MFTANSQGFSLIFCLLERVYHKVPLLDLFFFPVLQMICQIHAQNNNIIINIYTDDTVIYTSNSDVLQIQDTVHTLRWFNHELSFNLHTDYINKTTYSCLSSFYRLINCLPLKIETG